MALSGLPLPKLNFLTQSGAVRHGLRLALSAPGFVLFASAVGFGAMAKDVGLTLGHAAFLTAFLYAMPAQVLLADQVAKGASPLAAAFVISLTGIRLLPMTLSLLPLLSDDKPSRVKRILAVHFVAVTAWFEGLRQLPHVAQRFRLSYFIGLGASMLIATLIGTVVGYFLAGRVPTPVSATLLLTTPIYFFVSLIMAAKVRADWVAIALGAMLGPPIYLVAPGFDLMLAGIVGGTIAFVVHQRDAREVQAQSVGSQ